MSVTTFTTGRYVVSAVPAASYISPSPPWQLIHCDLFGKPVSHLSNIASERSYSCRLNRPAQLQFRVPSDDGNVRDMNSLSSTVRAYRREALSTGEEVYVLRFNGYVWTIEDNGEEEVAYTKVVCYDPFQRFTKRLVRSDTGSVTQVVNFFVTDAGTIMATLLQRTIGFGGNVGILAGSFDVCPAQTVSWQRKSVSDAYIDLMNATNGPDIAIVPREAVDGNIALLNVYAKRGSDSIDALFGWKSGPNNVKSIKRLEDAQTIANVLLGIGSMSSGGEVLSTQSDAAAILQVGQYEDIQQYSDVKSLSFLADLVTGDLNVRKLPNKIYGVTPVTDPNSLVPGPWNDYDLGDTVYVMAHEKLRGGFAKRGLRVYGWDIDIGDEVEVVSSVITAEDA